MGDRFAVFEVGMVASLGFYVLFEYLRADMSYFMSLTKWTLIVGWLHLSFLVLYGVDHIYWQVFLGRKATLLVWNYLAQEAIRVRTKIISKACDSTVKLDQCLLPLQVLCVLTSTAYILRTLLQFGRCSHNIFANCENRSLYLAPI